MAAASVLILDDQKAYVRALARSLPDRYKVIGAHSRHEAEEASAQVSGALVDIRLDAREPHDRSGLEFIRWLRQRNPGIPIIAMSALDEDGLAERTVDAGADLFLPKPIRVSELKDLLNRYFSPKE